jgi:hypothetical protein
MQELKERILKMDYIIVSESARASPPNRFVSSRKEHCIRT